MTGAVNEAAGWCALVHFHLCFNLVRAHGRSPRAGPTYLSSCSRPVDERRDRAGQAGVMSVMACATMAAGLPGGPAAARIGRDRSRRRIALCEPPRRRSCSSARWRSDFWRRPRTSVWPTRRSCLRNGLGDRPVQRGSSTPGSASACPSGWQPRTGGSFSAAPLACFPSGLRPTLGAALGYIACSMIALQFLGVVFLTIGATARLRSGASDHRERRSACPRMARPCPVWRFRRRPAVGDDPILRREMYTTRGNGLLKAAGCSATSAY